MWDSMRNLPMVVKDYSLHQTKMSALCQKQWDGLLLSYGI